MCLGEARRRNERAHVNSDLGSFLGGSPGERGSISGPDRKIGTCTGNGLTQTGTSSRFRFFGGVVDPTWLDFGSRLVDLGSCRAQIYSRVSASPRNGDQMYCMVSVTHRLLTGTPSRAQMSSRVPVTHRNGDQVYSRMSVTHRYSPVLPSSRAEIYSRVPLTHRNGDQISSRMSVTGGLLTGTPIFPGPT